MINSKPNISFVTKNNICTGCGVCRGACPSKAISFQIINGEFRPLVDESKCNNAKGCHRCYDSCPGIGVDLIGMGKQIHPGAPKENRYIGRFIKCFTGYSTNNDIRYHAASGGLTSQFLIWLLENKKIDGAVVTKFDKNAPLKVKTFIAQTSEDILSAKSSKYAPVSFSDVFQSLREAPGENYVVVGTPCQIEGMRKLLNLDRRLSNKICGLFSVFCSGSRTFNFTEYVMRERNIDIENINYLAYRDNGCLGGLVAKGIGVDFYEDYQSYCHPLRTIFHPRRCILCADHFGELSDISFGDIHVKPFSNDKIGINSVVVRNPKWLALLEDARNANALVLNELNAQTLLDSQIMARIKKGRNISFGLIRKKLGKTSPNYGFNYDGKIGVKTVIDFVQISLQQYIGRHRLLWRFIPLLKKKVKVD